jgi:hypothetical protein
MAKAFMDVSVWKGSNPIGFGEFLIILIVLDCNGVSKKRIEFADCKGVFWSGITLTGMVRSELLTKHNPAVIKTEQLYIISSIWCPPFTRVNI